MVRATLALVAADEADVIKRCLESVKNLVQQVYVSFNGDIDDGTKEAVTEWCEENSMPLVFWFDRWRGYGKTKTRNLDKIRAEMETDYIVFLDCDEVFITNKDDPNSYPTEEDAKKIYDYLDEHPEYDYMGFDTLHLGKIYPRWQIIRNNQRWVWHLPYQEILVGEKSNNSMKSNWLYNYSRKEGFNKKHPEAIYNNIARCEKWLKKHPDSEYAPRLLFELANAYFYVNAHRALDLYKQRIRMTKGFDQEKYLSCLHIARLVGSSKYKRMGDKLNLQRRRKYLLKAIDIVPERLEAYYKLMRDAMRANKNREAMGWGLMAPVERTIPYRCYFHNVRVYDHLFDHFLGVCTYWAKSDKPETQFYDAALHFIGYELSLRSVLGEHILEPTRLQSIKNSNIHLERIKALAKPFCETHFDMRSEASSSSVIPVSSSSPILPGFSHNKISLLVVDNFYKNPDEIRSMALSMDFNVEGTYPGKRTASVRPEGIKEAFERLLGARITYWPDTYNGSFQLTYADHKSWIHRDKTDWSVVVFLTPNAPKDGGTKIYHHKETGLTYTSGNESLETLLRKDSYNEDAWEVVDKVGNLYNRAIFFRGRMSHMSDRYFGTVPEDGRLFQTFFFDTEK